MLPSFLTSTCTSSPAPGRLHTAHHLPGKPVQPAQPGQPVAGQHPMHRGRVQSEQVADSCWSPPAHHPNLDDASLRARRRPTWAVVRPRRAINHPGLAHVAVSARPPGRSGWGRPGTVRQPAATASPRRRHNEPGAAGHVQTTRSYGGTRRPPSGAVRSSAARTSLGGLRLVITPRRHQRPWSVQLAGLLQVWSKHLLPRGEHLVELVLAATGTLLR